MVDETRRGSAAQSDNRAPWDDRGSEHAAPFPDPVGPAAPPPTPDPAKTELPLGPKRLHPAWILLSLVGLVRGFAIPLVLVLFGGGERGQVWFLTIGGGLALVGLGFQAANWWMLQYQVTGGEFRVRSGLLSRQERSVPLERIQAVDSSESVLQRLFGVQQVKIETAAGGAGRSDVRLEALGHGEAAALLQRLAVGRRTEQADIPGATTATAAVPDDAFPPTGEVLRRITAGELLVAGLTSGRVGPALALLVAAWQLADDILGDDVYQRLALRAPDPSVGLIVVVVAIFAVVAWLLAIAGTVLTFGNFELRRSGDRLLISHGLLDRRRSTIPVRRIQAVTVTEGLLRLPFGLATVRVESAGYGQDSPESGVLSPIIRRSQVPDLLRTACPELAIGPDLLDGRGLRRLPARARPRYIMAEVWQTIGFAAGATALTAVLPWTPWWWGATILGLAPVAALYGLVQHRDTGWALDAEDRLVVRTRTLDRRTAIVPRRRVQLRAVTQNVLQRRADLANLGVAVASGGSGGRFGLRHLDVEQAFEIVERLGPATARGRQREMGAIVETPV